MTGLRRELLDIEDATGVRPPVAFHVLGVGPERAGASMTALLDRGGPKVDGVLVVGVAGGIDPELETGDLLLADRYALQDGAAQGAGQAIRPDTQMLQSARQAALDLSVPTFDGGSLTVGAYDAIWTLVQVFNFSALLTRRFLASEVDSQ